jgi:hypothetical protein
VVITVLSVYYGAKRHAVHLPTVVDAFQPLLQALGLGRISDGDGAAPAADGDGL